MIDDVAKRRETAVVVKATLVDLIHAPQRAQRDGPVAVIRSAFGLEVIDSDLLRCVQIPAGFGEQRRHVAAGAARFIFENFFALLCGGAIEASCRRLRCWQRQLVKMQRRKFWSDAVFLVLLVALLGSR